MEFDVGVIEILISVKIVFGPWQLAAQRQQTYSPNEDPSLKWSLSTIRCKFDHNFVNPLLMAAIYNTFLDTDLLLSSYPRFQTLNLMHLNVFMPQMVENG